MIGHYISKFVLLVKTFNVMHLVEKKILLNSINFSKNKPAKAFFTHPKN